MGRRQEEEKTVEGPRPDESRRSAGPGTAPAQAKAAERPEQAELTAAPVRREETSRAVEPVPPDARTPEWTETRRKPAAEESERPAETPEIETGLPVPVGPSEAEAAPALEYREPQPAANQLPGPVRASGELQTPVRPETVGRRQEEEKTAEGPRPYGRRQPAGPGTAPAQAKAAERPGQADRAAAPAGREAASRTERLTGPEGQARGGTDSRAGRAARGPERTEGIPEVRTGFPVPGDPKAEAAPALEYREPQPAADQVPGAVRASGEPQVFPRREPAQARRGEDRRMEGIMAQEGTAGTQTAVSDGLPLSARPLEDQVRLTYAQPQREAQKQSGEAEQTPPGRVEPFGMQNLPSWAQDMLRRTGSVPDGQGSGPDSIRYDAGRSGTQTVGPAPQSGNRSVPPSFGEGKQFVWSAPGATMPPVPPAPSASAQMVFRDRQTGTEPPFPQNRGMNEREIRKTADRVYRLIEERLRKELRRSGK